MMRPLKELIDDALRDIGQDLGVELLGAVRSGLKDCQVLCDRYLNRLLITILAYELIAHAGVSEVSLSGLKIGDLSFIEKLFPAAVGYFYYSLMSITLYRRLLREAHQQLMVRLRLRFIETGLDDFYHPPTGENFEYILRHDFGSRVRKLRATIFEALLAVLYIGPAAYLVYMVGRSFIKFGARDIVAWLVLLIATMFLIQVTLLCEGISRVTRPERRSTE